MNDTVWREQVAPLIDRILAAHTPADAQRLPPYRNHVYRMTRFALALDPALDPIDLAVAGACHDLALLTVPTWDYLAPSVALASGWLDKTGQARRLPRISAMILNHHKLRPCRDDAAAETFRRADLIDVSLGLIRFGLPPSTIRAIRRAHPNAGFHRFLLGQSARALLTRPWSPLPMLRW